MVNTSHVAIRLQNHGAGKTRYWFIIAQGRRKNNKGRFVEKLGMWAPSRGYHRQRQIILNKHRLRYWIRVGAQPTTRVHWLMAYGAMLPNIWVPYGFQHLYDRKQEVNMNPERRIMKFKGYYPKQEDYYKSVRNHEEENLMFRKLKAEMHVNDQQNLDPLQDFTNVEVNEIQSDDETEFGRTQKVYHLNNLLKKLDEENINLPSSKRQLIIQKLKRLSLKGIMGDQEYQSTLEKSLNSTMEQGKVVVRNAMILNALDKFRQIERNIKDFDDSTQPVNREDCINHLKRFSKMDQYEIDSAVDELMEYAEKNNYKITRGDLQDMTAEMPHIHDIRTFQWQYKHNDDYATVVPTKVPITPFVKADDASPEEFFDARAGYGEPIKVNEVKKTWFDVDKDFDYKGEKKIKVRSIVDPKNRTKVNKQWVRNWTEKGGA